MVGTSTAASVFGYGRGGKTQGYLNALLEVSLSSVRVRDPVQQAQIILDVIIKLLRAERGFLFLIEGLRENLVQRAGRDRFRNDLMELIGYSRSIVDQVQLTKNHYIYTADDLGEKGTQSMIVHGLKSVMAAPIILRDELLGVVYLDSRMGGET